MSDGALPAALLKCFHTFDDAGVSWCLLRPVPGCAAEPGDIDLLVGAGQLDVACMAAAAAGFVTVPGHSHGRNLLRFASDSARWFWLHLVDEISFGPFYRLQTHAELPCLARAECGVGVRRLHAADEFWITLLHCLLDKGRIAAKHRVRLQDLAPAADDGGPVESCVGSILHAGVHGRPFVDQLIEEVRDGKWDAVEQHRSSLLEAWLRRGAVRAPSSLLQRVRGAVAYRLRGWHRRGITVALLGPDGAGKTTVAAAIADGFPFPTRLVYMGLTGGLLRIVHRLRIPGVVLAGQVIVLWSRCLYAFALKSRGHLIVFDRYVYDAAVPTPQRLTMLQRGSRWAAGHVCPRPDLIVVLSAPGAVMFARKGEYTVSELDDWREHFLRLKHRFPDLQVIDTTFPINVVRTDVLNRIWQAYAERWG